MIGRHRDGKTYEADTCAQTCYIIRGQDTSNVRCDEIHRRVHVRPSRRDEAGRICAGVSRSKEAQFDSHSTEVDFHKLLTQKRKRKNKPPGIKKSRADLERQSKYGPRAAVLYMVHAY